MVRHPFAHEPNANRGPKGEFILFWSENHYDMPLCNCSDGSTPGDCKTPDDPMYYTYMSFSNTPNGPWSNPVAILGPKRHMDTNFSPVILKNGSLVGFSRWAVGDVPFSGGRMHLVVASNWKDPTTYIESPHDVFQNLTNGGCEDPFLYLDKNGYYHAILHNLYPNFYGYNCGGHAFSKDGLQWTYGGRAYGNTVQFTDGNSFVFSRRERPHLVFAEDDVTPVALTTSAQYGGQYFDASYTLLQPIGP